MSTHKSLKLEGDSERQYHHAALAKPNGIAILIRQVRHLDQANTFHRLCLDTISVRVRQVMFLKVKKSKS